MFSLSQILNIVILKLNQKPYWYKNNGLLIFLTIACFAFWLALLFLVVGFFMIKPVAFYNKISGKGLII